MGGFFKNHRPGELLRGFAEDLKEVMNRRIRNEKQRRTPDTYIFAYRRDRNFCCVKGSHEKAEERQAATFTLEQRHSQARKGQFD